MEVAKLIYSHFSTEGEMRLYQAAHHSGDIPALMEKAKNVCTDTEINSTTMYSGGNFDVTGPIVYLIKLLVRQFSFPCLKQASEKYPWIVPEGLRTSNLVSLFQNLKEEPFCLVSPSINWLRVWSTSWREWRQYNYFWWVSFLRACRQALIIQLCRGRNRLSSSWRKWLLLVDKWQGKQALASFLSNKNVHTYSHLVPPLHSEMLTCC